MKWLKPFVSSAPKSNKVAEDNAEFALNFNSENVLDASEFEECKALRSELMKLTTDYDSAPYDKVKEQEMATLQQKIVELTASVERKRDVKFLIAKIRELQAKNADH